MGGIKVDYKSKTSCDHLYAIGETACNGVHGKNRLASNSLLESMVFAKFAAEDITEKYGKLVFDENNLPDLSLYKDGAALDKEYRKIVLDAIDKANEETK